MKKRNIDTLEMLQALKREAERILEPETKPSTFTDYLLLTSAEYAAVELNLSGNKKIPVWIKEMRERHIKKRANQF